MDKSVVKKGKLANMEISSSAKVLSSFNFISQNGLQYQLWITLLPLTFSIRTRVSNMNFTKNNNPNPFRSSRLLYRAIESPQDDEIFHDLHKNPEIYKDADPNLPVPPCRRRTTFLRQYYQRAILGVLICVVNEGSDARETPVGTVSLSNTAGASMTYHRTADLIISIAPAYQNKGYGTEAMRWTLHWAFGKANLHRVTLKVTSYNKRAIEFYKRVGFRVESKEKESIWHDNEWHDMLGMGDMMFYNPIEHLSANTSQRYSILNGMLSGKATVPLNKRTSLDRK